MKKIPTIFKLCVPVIVVGCGDPVTIIDGPDPICITTGIIKKIVSVDSRNAYFITEDGEAGHKPHHDNAFIRTGDAVCVFWDSPPPKEPGE